MEYGERIEGAAMAGRDSKSCFPMHTRFATTPTLVSLRLLPSRGITTTSHA
jgi:hypothetical protein